MKIGKACAIFKQIESDKYAIEEKGAAIYEVLKMPTHNSVTKEQMLSVIRFLFPLAFEFPEEAEAKKAPKAPFPDGDGDVLACPNCGSGEYLHNADENENAYCGQCGQAIAWKGATGIETDL